jgi:hypothetical protein
MRDIKCIHCGEPGISIHTVNCPKCGNRVRCPECGSLLKILDHNTIECPSCKDFQIPITITAYNEKFVSDDDGAHLPKEVAIKVDKAEKISEWDKKRWEFANQLLFPEKGVEAVLLFIVKGDDIKVMVAECPDFTKVIGGQVDHMKKYLSGTLLIGPRCDC